MGEAHGGECSSSRSSHMTVSAAHWQRASGRQLKFGGSRVARRKSDSHVKGPRTCAPWRASPADMLSLSQAPKCPSQAAVSRALGSSSGCCVCFGRSRQRPQFARRIRDRRWKFRGCILIRTSFTCTFSDHRRAAHCGSRPQTWGSQADGPAAWSPQDRWTDIASANPRRCAWAQGRGSGSPLLWDRTHRAR